MEEKGKKYVTGAKKISAMDWYILGDKQWKLVGIFSVEKPTISRFLQR